jgi:hypothetical protein
MAKPSWILALQQAGAAFLAVCGVLLSGCGPGDVESDLVKDLVPQYNVGGTVSGLTGGGLVLQDNGGDNLSVPSDGSFMFSASLTSGSDYAVTVLTQPSNPSQTCTVTNGSGKVTSNTTTVQVSCAAAAGNSATEPPDAVLSEVQGQWLQIVQQGGDFTSAMAQYLQSLPALSNVTEEPDGSVSAQFSDGQLLIVAHNRALTIDATSSSDLQAKGARAPSTPAAEPRARDAAAARDDAAAASAAIRMPNKTAVIAQGFGSLDDSTVALTSDITQWLNTAGYSAVALPSATTPQMLRTAVQGVDLFLYTGHGGLGSTQQGPTAGNVYALSTSVVTSNYMSGLPPVPAQTADDAADFANGRLVYMIDDVGSDPTTGVSLPGTFWAITGAFVEKYMSFNSGSLVVINACSSATGVAISQGFPASFQTAGTYVGWTGTTSDLGNDRIRYLFDRLLGEVPGVSRTDVTPESPVQRAFNLSAVLQYMTAQGLIPLNQTGTSPTTADGNLVSLGPNDAILAPSIAFISTNEIADQLDIAGIFDPSQQQNASITIGGENCPITTWDATYAICTLPGPTSEGAVIVSVNGIQSNAVELTSWRGAFTYQVTGQGSQQATAILNLHWRADAHNWRLAPGTTPQHYDFAADFAQDSTASWTASGSQTVIPPPPGPSQTVTLAGGGNIPWAPASTGLLYFAGYVIIDPASGTQWTTIVGEAPLVVSGNGCTAGPYNLLISTPEALQSVSWYASPPPLGNTQVVGQAVPLALDATYDLLPSALSNTYEAGCPFALLAGNQPWKLSWLMISPTNPPDPNAAQ